MSTATDPDTAARIRHEFEQVRAALQGQTATAVSDPLGVDGVVNVTLNVWRHTGAGEVVLQKGDSSGDHRYTKFRSWGPNGNDFIEKSSFLKRADGATEFHKRRVEAGDKVTIWDQPEAEDQGWCDSLA